MTLCVCCCGLLPATAPKICRYGWMAVLNNCSWVGRCVDVFLSMSALACTGNMSRVRPAFTQWQWQWHLNQNKPNGILFSLTGAEYSIYLTNQKYIYIFFLSRKLLNRKLSGCVLYEVSWGFFALAKKAASKLKKHSDLNTGRSQNPDEWMINKVLDYRCRSDQRHNLRTSRGCKKSFLTEWVTHVNTTSDSVMSHHVNSWREILMRNDSNQNGNMSECERGHWCVTSDMFVSTDAPFPKKTCSSFSLRQAPIFLEGKVEAVLMTWMIVTADFYLSVGPRPVSTFCET